MNRTAAPPFRGWHLYAEPTFLVCRGRPGASGWLGYQHRVQQGLVEHKVGTFTRADGSEKVTEQVRITAKGLARLAETFGGGAAVVAA